MVKDGLDLPGSNPTQYQLYMTQNKYISVSVISLFDQSFRNVPLCWSETQTSCFMEYVEVSFLWIHLFLRKLILSFVFLPYIIDIQCQGTEDNQEVEYTVILVPLELTVKETRIDHC